MLYTMMEHNYTGRMQEGDMSAHTHDDGDGKEGDGEGDTGRDARDNASGGAQPSLAFWRGAS